MAEFEHISLKLPVPVSEIWGLERPFLRNFHYGYYQEPTWAECLSEASRSTRGDVIGELHLKGDVQTDDFKQVPIGRCLAIIMMPQGEGFILRWLDERTDSASSILGGLGHDNLLRYGDDEVTPVRSGWMIVRDADTLEFWEIC